MENMDEGSIDEEEKKLEDIDRKNKYKEWERKEIVMEELKN